MIAPNWSSSTGTGLEPSVGAISESSIVVICRLRRGSAGTIASSSGRTLPPGSPGEPPRWCGGESGDYAATPGGGQHLLRHEQVAEVAPHESGTGVTVARRPGNATVRQGKQQEVTLCSVNAPLPAAR